jgi:hypothetical protein
MAVRPGKVLLHGPLRVFSSLQSSLITSAHPPLFFRLQGFFDDKFPSVTRFIPAHMANRGDDDDDDDEQE